MVTKNLVNAQRRHLTSLSQSEQVIALLLTFIPFLGLHSVYADGLIPSRYYMISYSSIILCYSFMFLCLEIDYRHSFDTNAGAIVFMFLAIGCAIWYLVMWIIDIIRIFKSRGNSSMCKNDEEVKE